MNASDFIDFDRRANFAVTRQIKANFSRPSRTGIGRLEALLDQNFFRAGTAGSIWSSLNAQTNIELTYTCGASARCLRPEHAAIARNISRWKLVFEMSLLLNGGENC